MKILLCNAPWIRNGIFGVRAGSRWPHFQEDTYLPFPFFLAYAGAVLEKEGHEVYLIDAIAERIGVNELINRIKQIQPRLVLFEISTPSLDDDLNIAKITKETFGDNLKVAFSGLHYELYHPEFLNKYSFLDFLLYGEYEYTLRDLAKSNDPGKVNGLIYRNPNGEIIKTPPRPLIEDLDELPWPLRDKLPIYRYSDLPGGIPSPSLQMWASRGCPYKCIFCAWPQLMYGSSRYRARDPVKVVDEMEYCIKRYGFKSVYFDDDTFNIGNERMSRICEEIRKRKLNIPWAIMARADTSTKEILHSMKEAGLYALKFGVESGVQEIVDRSCKNLNLEKVSEAVSWCKELGIRVHLTFMFGLPGETKETIKETIRFALGLNPDSVQYSIATPFPGSYYYKLLEGSGQLTTKDWTRYDGARHAVIKTETLSEKDLESAIRYGYRKWNQHVLKRRYMSKRYILKGLLNPLRAVKTLSKIFS